MNDLEKFIWASAFSSVVLEEAKFLWKHGKEIDNVSSFSCGEMADFVLEKFKALEQSEDKEYLIPFKCNWFAKNE